MKQFFSSPYLLYLLAIISEGILHFERKDYCYRCNYVDYLDYLLVHNIGSDISDTHYSHKAVRKSAFIEEEDISCIKAESILFFIILLAKVFLKQGLNCFI
jgi:hypothetical protein